MGSGAQERRGGAGGGEYRKGPVAADRRCLRCADRPGGAGTACASFHAPANAPGPSLVPNPTKPIQQLPPAVLSPHPPTRPWPPVTPTGRVLRRRLEAAEQVGLLRHQVVLEAAVVAQRVAHGAGQHHELQGRQGKGGAVR